MSLSVGARLGHYAVTAKIGEGGMGEVGCSMGNRPLWRSTIPSCDSPTAPSIQEALIITRPGSDLAFLSVGGLAQGEIQNVGPGCASNVGGVTRLFDEANVQVAQLAWYFPDRVVQSGETSFYEACCLSGGRMGQLAGQWNFSCRVQLER